MADCSSGSASSTSSDVGIKVHTWKAPCSAASYITTSFLMTTLTKYAASVWGFPGSSFLLLIECIATVGSLYLVASPGQYQPFSRAILQHIPLVTLSKALNMYLSFIAMARVSLPVYNVLKRLQPIYALVQDWLIRGSIPTGWETVGVLLVCAGTIGTGIGDLDFDLRGYVLAIIASGTQSLYLVLSKRAEDRIGKLSSTDMLFYTAFFNIFIFGPLTATEASDISAFLKRPGEIGRTAFFLVPYVVNGALLNFTTFWCNSANSPLATAVAGSLKGVVSTIVGLLLFQSRMTSVGWLGLVVSTLGAFVYSVAHIRKRKKA